MEVTPRVYFVDDQLTSALSLGFGVSSFRWSPPRAMSRS